ncbi:MAG: hypothetical protein WC517_02310 [Patescibacteria group bacterium]
MNPNQDIIGGLLSGSQDYLQTGDWLQQFSAFANQDPATIGIQMMLHGGWVLFIIVLMWGIYKDVFLEYRAGQYMGKWKHVLLAVDIPKNNEQTPKAVENLFAAMAGVFTSSNLIDKYWNGKVTESFSFEVVSIDGHTRFLIRTPTHFRDFIESIVYSQYPDAEINEVSDYVDYDSEELDAQGRPVSFRKLKFPNKIYNLWGSEFVLVKPYPYPIRTYIEFEHQQTQTFLDPMANLLEVMSKLNPGEQAWLQIVIQPQPPGWGEEAKKIVATSQGKDYKAPEKFDPTKIISGPMGGVAAIGGGLMNEAFGINPFGSGEDKKKEEDQWKMFKISPGERDVLIRVERKLSKQAFKVKFRLVYLGRKDVFAKGRGVTGIVGSIQQFNTADANAFKPGGLTKTSADYFFVDRRIAERQNRILRWYCNRSAWYGESNNSSKLTLLNPEELATMWHFPVMTVKASQLEKIGSKRAAPPTRLPYHERAAPAAKKESHRQGPTRVAPLAPLAPGQTAPASPIAPVERPSAAADYPPVAPVAPHAPSAMPISSDSALKKAAPPSNLPFA